MTKDVIICCSQKYGAVKMNMEQRSNCVWEGGYRWTCKINLLQCYLLNPYLKKGNLGLIPGF